jgi:hypothetical protein
MEIYCDDAQAWVQLGGGITPTAGEPDPRVPPAAAGNLFL